MTVESLSSEDNVKLRHVIDTGVKTAQEIAALREGLRDTIKEVAKELSMVPKDIRKAIRSAFKESIDEERAQIENTELILSSVGRR